MRLFSLKNIQFDQIIQSIQSYLTNSSGTHKTINKSTVFGQLITIMAGLAHNIMLYIEDALTEQNKYTVQRKKSVVGLAAFSGYQPSYGKAAGVWVQISHQANNEQSLDVIVPDHTRILCSQNGLYYNLVLNKSAMVIKSDINLTNNYYYAVQGKFEVQRFSAIGGRLYCQNFKFLGFIDTDYIEVRVNGELWTKRDSLYDMEPNEMAYMVRYNPTAGVDIIFGNKTHGMIVQPGALIEVSYLLHDGASGNMDVREHPFFLFGEKLYDISGEEVDGNAVFEISLATDDSVAAGSDTESIAQLKQMIGFNSRSLVLADSNAYSAILNRYSFVGYNRTWSEPGSMVINSLVMRNYALDMKDGNDYFELTPDKFRLSLIQKESIKNAIVQSGHQLAGTTYNIVDIDLCKYALFIYIKLRNANADHQIVSAQIKRYVGEFFGNIKSDSYVPKSDIINLIKENIEEVDGVNCYFLSEKNETALQKKEYTDRQYIYDPSVGTYRTKEVTVHLMPGENPMLGLDSHGNIVVDADNEFPVLMGGWDYQNMNNQEVTVVDPLTIAFE